jgi:hypothetical protein
VGPTAPSSRSSDHSGRQIAQSPPGPGPPRERVVEAEFVEIQRWRPDSSRWRAARWRIDSPFHRGRRAGRDCVSHSFGSAGGAGSRATSSRTIGAPGLRPAPPRLPCGGGVGCANAVDLRAGTASPWPQSARGPAFGGTEASPSGVGGLRLPGLRFPASVVAGVLDSRGP